MVAPVVHSCLPLREVFGAFILHGIDGVSNVPEVLPFGVKGWRDGCHGLVLRSVLLDLIFNEPDSFNEFGSDSHLIIMLFKNILNRPAGIVFSSSFGEQLFHDVDKCGVFLLIDTRVLDDQASIFIEGVSDDFALFGTVFSLEEGFNIDDGDVEMGGLVRNFSKDFS